MGFWTFTSTEYRNWLKAGKKVKKGASPDEAGIAAEMLETYGEIARRYDSSQRIGMSRLPYAAPSTVINVFQGGFFANKEWRPRVRLQTAQPQMTPIYKYEMNYHNSVGYWLGLQQAAFSLMGQVDGEPETATTEELGMLGAWGRILGEYSLRVLAVRQEFYRNSVKEPVAARLNQELFEEDAYLPANEALDDRRRQMEGMRETQLMKAIASLAASNKMKRAGAGAADK